MQAALLDHMMVPSSPRFALISGGSSGIGLACAKELARRGYPLALMARDGARLHRAATDLRAAGARVKTMMLDVGDADASIRAVDLLVDRFGPPSWLINSAGIAEPGLFLDQPLSAHEAQMRTNYYGSLYLAHAAARHMTNAGGGRMVFISSGAGLYGIHGYAAYAPSKFAVRGLAEVLRVELAQHRISVTVAYPPDTRTPQLEAEEQTKPAATRRITAGGGRWEAEAVARKIVAGAEAGRFMVTPGLPTTVVAAFHSLIAPILRARQRRLIRKAEDVVSSAN